MWCKKVAVALFACSAFAAQAQTANVTTQFSFLQNPGGSWSYGSTSTLGNFNLNLFNWAFGSMSGAATGWAGQDPATVSDANPSVLYLMGNGPVFNFSTISAPSNSVNLHPGPNGEISVARWIAPTAGLYLISGAFRGNDTTGTTTDVHVLHNATQLVNGSISGLGDTENFSQTVLLAAGDRVDFAVGAGGNGYFNDSTGLSAVISAVPEPSSYALLLAGLGVIGFIANRRRGVGSA